MDITNYAHLNSPERLKNFNIQLLLLFGIVGVIFSVYFAIYFTNKEQICDDVARDHYNETRNVKSDEERIKEFLENVAKCKSRSQSWDFSVVVSPANAATSDALNTDPLKRITIAAIMCSLPLFLFFSMGALLYSKNENIIKFSMDTIKTLLGFLVGVATSFLH